jgi:peptidyl-prolyl cis-trans isomerase D
MFEFLRTHTRTLMLIFVPLIIGSFVFVGVQGYDKMSDNAGAAKVAKVGGHDIVQAQWDSAYRESVEQVRRQAPQVDVKMFDTPELRYQVLERLVNNRLIQTAAEQSRFSTTDDRLLRSYMTDPRFAQVRQPDGSFNKPLLEALLAQQGMSVPGFEAQLRNELVLRQVTEGVSATAFAPAAAASSALDAMLQQREVQIERFEAKNYTTKLNLTDADVEAYYKDPAIAQKFKSLEQADIEYVVLDLDVIKKTVMLPDEELRKYYDANEKKFTVPEERRARHILIKTTKSNTDAERTAARTKAEALLVALQKNPTQFAELAKKNSEETATAAKGGDNDVFFARGEQDPAYETALFALKLNELSGLVEAKDGFYILRLEALRGGEKRSFESAKIEIQEELTQKTAKQRYTEVTQEFNNLTYDQPDSLKPVAEKLKLEVFTAKAVTRISNMEAKGPLASTKFIEALFGNDSLNNKRNTEAVSLKDNKMVSGRVVSYRPSVVQPLADVKDRVKAALTATRAAELARQEGEARLTALKAAPAMVLTSAKQTVSRAQDQGLSKEVLDAILKSPATQLPVVLGVDLKEQGYVVTRLNRVLAERDAAGLQGPQLQIQYGKALTQAEEKAYMDALKTRYKVEMKVPAPVAASKLN